MTELYTVQPDKTIQLRTILLILNIIQIAWMQASPNGGWLTTLILAVGEIYPQSSGREDADSGTDMCFAGRPYCLLLSLLILKQFKDTKQSSLSLDTSLMGRAGQDLSAGGCLWLIWYYKNDGNVANGSEWLLCQTYCTSFFWWNCWPNIQYLLSRWIQTNLVIASQVVLEIHRALFELAVIKIVENAGNNHSLLSSLGWALSNVRQQSTANSVFKHIQF